MKKKRKRIIIIAILIVLLIILGILILNRDSNKLSSSEKQWISNNSTIIQNINVLNDSNIFGNLGSGVFYSFLDAFREEYGLQFNLVTITNSEQPSSLVLGVSDELRDGDLSFYTDHYVLVAKKSETNIQLADLQNKKIGVLSSSEAIVRDYFSDFDVSIVSYSSFSDLKSAFSGDQVHYILVPRMEYIDVILENNYSIVYHMSDLKRYFYLGDELDSTLFHIMQKYYHKWSSKNLESAIYKEELSIFQDSLDISSAAIDEIKKSTIEYAFINNLPYEVYGDGTFGGILSEYVNSFAQFLNLDIEYTKYGSLKKMMKQLNNDEIILYFNYHTSIALGSIVETNIPLSFDIYAHESNDIVINSLSSLKNQVIYVEENSLLYQNLAKISGLQLLTYEKDKLNSVLKNKENMIAFDSETGEYLKRTSLISYTSRYHGDLGMTYSLKSTGNETFNLLLTKYINYMDNHTAIERGLYSASVTEKKGSFISGLAKYALYTVLVVIVILIFIYRSSKKVRMQKKIKKEDKLKFIDQLTSVKNRNYLNENLSAWNKNTIYPQCIIMIDLNRVQEINDTLGYEEGDRQIKGAANSLIKTQLDNTDIIRTNGNEFVIYLVGYNQKQVTSYIHKLTKEFKNLPYDYGVCITYSMIESDLKSIEDALNECVEEIKKQKGKEVK